jgi:hypothetical protein
MVVYIHGFISLYRFKLKTSRLLTLSDYSCFCIEQVCYFDRPDFQQTVGIPSVVNCAPLLFDLFLPSLLRVEIFTFLNEIQ